MPSGRRLALALLAIAMTGLSGCLREQHDPNFIRIAAIDVAAPQVTSGTVALAVNVTLDNSRGPSGPVQVVAKAFDTASGLLTATAEAEVGAIAKDKSVPVPLRLEVPRRSGYRLDVSVAEDGRIVQTGSVTASNLGALAPNVHQTGLHIGAMDFLVRNVTGQRVAIEAAIPVTNEAAAAHRPLRLQVKAREVSTGLVADEAWANVEGIAPEATVPVAARLEVPGGYNYEVEAVLWDGNVTVGRGAGKVQLLPTFTRDATEEVVVTHPEIRDFVRPGERMAEQPGPGGAAARTPGPGVALAALAAAGAAAVLGRRRP